MLLSFVPAIAARREGITSPLRRAHHPRPIRMNQLTAAVAVIVLFAALAPAAEGPPVAPVRNVTDTHHGVKVDDPYRYFENFRDPEVQSWTRAQADYAEKALRAIPGRDQLLKRIEELDKGVPYRLTVIRRWPNGDLHYLKRLA